MAINKYITRAPIIYLFITIILLLVILYYIITIGNFFSKDKPKCLIILHGGTFKTEGNMSVLKKDETEFIKQKIATLSQADFINNINYIYGIESDIILSTFSKNNKNDVKNWLYQYIWSNNLNILNVINTRDKDANDEDNDNAYIKNAVKLIDKKKLRSYKFVVFIKSDVYLKPEIFNYFDPTSKKLIFVARKDNRVNTNVTIIPSIFFRKLFFNEQVFELNLSIDQYKERCQLKDDDEIQFMLDETVNIEESNPIYHCITTPKP